MWSKSSWTKGGKTGKGKNKAADSAEMSWNPTTTWNDTGKGVWNAPSAGTTWGNTWGSEAYAGDTTKGKGWGSSTTTGQDSTKGKGKEWVSRLEGKYALAKTILRPYADEQGHAVYTQGSTLEFFGKHNMRQIIDARNSELARRPAIGISVVSSSLLALTNCLAEEDTDQDKKFQEALQEMRRLFSGEDGAAFRKACDTLCKDRSNQNSAEKRRKAVEIWVGFFRKHKDTLQKALPPMLSRASLLYMSGMQALESCTLTNALGNWSNKIPTTVANEASLSKWQASPKTLKLLVDYLVEALGQRQADDTAWKQAHGGWGGDSDDDAEADDGRDTWGIPATEGRKRKTTSQSSSTSSSKRRRKAAKKAEKRKAKKAAKAGKDTHREELPSLEADDVEAR